MPRLASLLAILIFGLPAVAHAGAELPPGGQVLWGGQGGYSARDISAFQRQSGKHPAVFNLFVKLEQNSSTFHWLGFRLDDARRERARMMLTLDAGNLSPAAIARGDADRYYAELCRTLAEHGTVVYLRPLSEMNNGANAYSAYDESGRPRGAAFSPRQLRRAFRRIAVIVRGGDISAGLRDAGLPPFRGDAAELPRPRVALAWVPLSFGSPEIPANHPARFWPGSRWVDWVGTTWYSPYRASSAMHAFYRNRLWDDKPFTFAEWGVWGRDDPGFVRQFFGFLRSHPRVRMAVYYQSAALSPEFRLSSHPRTRRALRRAVRWPRLSGFAPEHR